MDQASIEGKAWGKEQNASLSPGSTLIDDLLQNNTEEVDPEKLRELVKSKYIPKTEPFNFLQSPEVQSNSISLDEEEYYLTRSDRITEMSESHEMEEVLEHTIHTCEQSDAPFPMKIIRSLEVEVIHHPEKIKQVKRCKGHETNVKRHNKKKAKEVEKRQRETFSSDATVETFNVIRYKSGKNWHVKTCWKHLDDTIYCDIYQTHKEVIQPESWQEAGEKWIYENNISSARDLGPECTFFKKSCLDQIPSKIIKGKEIKRQCWREELSFLCKVPTPSQCPYFKNSNCEIIKRHCLSEGSHGCMLWEFTFKCYSQIYKKTNGIEDLYKQKDEYGYEPNDSFSEVATKLAVFEEIKHDLEASQAADSRQVQIFKGKRMECRKSLADKVTYDCCFSYSGLAKKIGLKTCNADELALADMRERGLCHYIGPQKEKLLDLVKIGETHVFCCFDSKLARILQEQGRDQLAISWEKPHHTNCRGFTLDEISQINFSTLDFGEIYSDVGTVDFSDKLSDFQKKFEKKLEKHD